MIFLFEMCIFLQVTLTAFAGFFDLCDIVTGYYKNSDRWLQKELLKITPVGLAICVIYKLREQKSENGDKK